MKYSLLLVLNLNGQWGCVLIIMGCVVIVRGVFVSHPFLKVVILSLDMS